MINFYRPLLFAVPTALLLVAVPTLLLVGKPFAASPGRAGENWTHAELAKHLETKGFNLRVVPTNQWADKGPAAYFDAGSENYIVEYLDAWQVRDVALVQKVRTAEEARDKAGAKGDKAASWGRFLFVGDPAFVARIRAALLR